MDDKDEGDAVDADSNSSDSDEGRSRDDEDIAGVTLNTLLEAHKHLNFSEDAVGLWRTYMMLRRWTQDPADDDGSTKLWKMKDLGLQTTHSIMSSQVGILLAIHIVIYCYS